MTNQRADEIRDQGFTILRGVFPKEEVQKLSHFVERLAKEADKGDPDPFDRWYLNHRTDQGVLYDLYQRHPEFCQFARNERILDTIAEVLGPDLFIYENSLIYKPAGRKNGVPLHQDFISRSNEPKKIIAWMAIDDVRRDNGALKVIKGSHKEGFLPWHRVRGETHHDRLDLDTVDLSKTEHVELDAGDVLIFDQLVVHGSDEAHSDDMRFVYRVSYQGFDEIYVPRGAPMVVRGGGPEAISKRFSGAHEKGPGTRFINRVGAFLQRTNLGF